MGIAALDQAEMVSSPDAAAPAFVVGTSFDLESGHGEVSSARLVATAHGVYEATLNGARVGDRVLAPGWTSYEFRLQVQTYELEGLREQGNELSFEVGNGWWRGSLGFWGADANYGSEIGVVATVVITYADGHEQRVNSGADWQVTRSQTTFDTLYDGQHIDLRITPGEPQPARVIEFDRATLVPQVDAGVVRHETIAPQRIWTSPSGKTLVDFGQNLVGWIRFTAPADPGRVITLRHAEVLERDELGTRPLRSAKATDVITCGDTAQVVEPTFTFHGFRYAEVTGWPGELTADDLEGVVVHTDMRRTGDFRCSDDRVNQLMSNIAWGLRGNFLDVPTDCPQRDERMGWTGDIAVFAPTATQTYDVADILHKWLLDLRVDQVRRGTVPSVSPDIFQHFKTGDHGAKVGALCVWGDAAVWVPEALWNAYGDLERLREHYAVAAAHVDSIAAALSPTGLWDTGFQYGDWVDPDAPPDKPAAAKADVGVVATACAVRSATVAAHFADLLGHTEDRARFLALAERTRAAFHEHYIDAETGRIKSDCATVYALAICFGVVDGRLREQAGDRLAELVTAAGYKISTGFAGTPYVTWALTDTGHVTEAYRLLLEDACPSWLYPITMGATTIWERWDSMLPDGSINPGEMTSFNHYALGAVGDWLHQVVGGIRPAAPGFAQIRFEPVPGPGLDWAEASLETPHGLAACRWKRDGDQLEVTVVAPDVPATVVLPNGDTHHVGFGEHTFTIAA